MMLEDHDGYSMAHISRQVKKTELDKIQVEKRQVEKTMCFKFDLCREIEYMYHLKLLLGASLPISIIVKISYDCVNDPPELVRQWLYDLAYDYVSYYR